MVGGIWTILSMLPSANVYFSHFFITPQLKKVVGIKELAEGMGPKTQPNYGINVALHVYSVHRYS